MDYYVFIDESGGFDKIGDKSIVGGGITSIQFSKIRKMLKEMQTNVNAQTEFTFDINKDIHIAPLLHLDAKSGNQEQKARFKTISSRERTLFAQYCLETADQIFEKYVFSKNKGFDFGEIDAQERYGLNLVACVHKALTYLKEKNDAKNINIYIAPRSPKCLPDGADYKIYHSSLTAYIQSCFTDFMGPKININISFDKSNKKTLGFDMADVACYYFKHDQASILDKSLTTQPNKFYADALQKAEINIFETLLQKKEYETAYTWQDKIEKKKEILLKLINEEEKVKIDSIPRLLNIAYSLVDKRATEQGAMEEAVQLFKHLMSACNDNLNGNEKLSDYMISAVNGMLVCVNHTGRKDHQEVYLDFYKKNILNISSIPYFTRQEKILSIRNKAYNHHFNDYNFETIINDFEHVVKKRILDLPVYEKDSLTGEMLGTIGQAYAFLSKNHIEFAKKAEEYFINSEYHFIPGHMYHQMAINYMTTLSWYHNDLRVAKNTFAKHVDFDSSKSLEEWIENITDSTEYHLGSAFNISILIRIALSQGSINSKILENIESFLNKCETNQHPYELIYKWLGIAYLINYDLEKATNAFDISINLSKAQGFTLQTIAISTRGLKCIALRRQGKDIADNLRELKAHIRVLKRQSTNFENYIDSIGGSEKMLNDVEEENINTVAKWMPFSYA